MASAGLVGIMFLAAVGAAATAAVADAVGSGLQRSWGGAAAFEGVGMQADAAGEMCTDVTPCSSNGSSSSSSSGGGECGATAAACSPSNESESDRSDAAATAAVAGAGGRVAPLLAAVLQPADSAAPSASQIRPWQGLWLGVALIIMRMLA